MLKKEVLLGLNKQIQLELSAAYGYLALSVWFDQQVLKGFAKYFRKQTKEEQAHAMKLLDFVLDRNGEVSLGTVEAPKMQFGSVADACKFAREAERKNTASINALFEVAAKEGDLATLNHLQWFITEQVEEEKWAEEFVALAEQAGTKGCALLVLDQQIGERAEEGD